MPYLMVRQKVKDYRTWKSVFDERASALAQSGCKGWRFYQNVDDTSEIIVVVEYDDLANARAFTASQEAGQEDTLERAGVLDQPDGYFLNEIHRVDLTPPE